VSEKQLWIAIGGALIVGAIAWLLIESLPL